MPRADLRAAIQSGAAKLKSVLQALVGKATAISLEGEAKPKPPTLIMSIDQAEELFLADAQDEAQPFLTMLRELIVTDAPALIALFTIRSDNYERLQEAKELEDVRLETFSLPPMPKGSYADVIRGPARRALSKSTTRSSMVCSTTSRRAAPRMRCRCSPSRWKGSMASTVPLAISS